MCTDRQRAQPRDRELRDVNDDPRAKGGHKSMKAIKKKGVGRNSESFDPKSTLVRPAMRVLVGPNRPVLGKEIKHDDVVVVPEFFCKEDDWSLYYQLVEEMREVQSRNERGAEWIAWHEGAHLITKNPNGSKTYQMVQDKIAAYFDIAHKSVGTRFNWYRDSSDWKPFHHDSAAFNPQRAKNQNITVGVSFGATRELAFLSAKTGERLYFPQTNGMLFSFGRDVNINYKHGVNALPADEQDGKGRVSIILWGWAPHVKEEANSPPMLDDNTRGLGHSIHAGKRNNNNNNNNSNDRRDDRDRDRRDDRKQFYREGDRKDDRDRRDDRGPDRRDDRNRDDRRNDDRDRRDDRNWDDRRNDDRRNDDRDRRDDRNRDDRRNDDRDRRDDRNRDDRRNDDRDRRDDRGPDRRDDRNRDDRRNDDRRNDDRDRRDDRNRDDRRNDDRDRRDDRGPDRRDDRNRDDRRNDDRDRRELCRNFQASRCNWGSECRYAHE